MQEEEDQVCTTQTIDVSSSSGVDPDTVEPSAEQNTGTSQKTVTNSS